MDLHHFLHQTPRPDELVDCEVARAEETACHAKDTGEYSFSSGPLSGPRMPSMPITDSFSPSLHPTHI